jgi:hypothetical protein
MKAIVSISENFLKHLAILYLRRINCVTLQRAYNDAIFFGSMKFGLKWGLKSAVFAGLFMLVYVLHFL